MFFDNYSSLGGVRFPHLGATAHEPRRWKSPRLRGSARSEMRASFSLRIGEVGRFSTEFERGAVVLDAFGKIRLLFFTVGLDLFVLIVLVFRLLHQCQPHGMVGFLVGRSQIAIKAVQHTV